ncbi:MAG: DUF5615 family PIN-like protein [Bryobacteraceae bacterium]
MERADDQDILRVARDDDRVCITLDHDFHRYLALAQSTGTSVVFIRIEGLGAEGQGARSDRSGRLALRSSSVRDRPSLSKAERYASESCP